MVFIWKWCEGKVWVRIPPSKKNPGKTPDPKHKKPYHFRPKNVLVYAQELLRHKKKEIRSMKKNSLCKQ